MLRLDCLLTTKFVLNFAAANMLPIGTAHIQRYGLVRSLFI